MMYDHGFVVSVKNDKGEILRESKNKEVFLPCESEYSIYLKNNNNRNAFAKITIDGTDIFNGSMILVESYSNVTIDRFCIDGDMDSGNKLKFVKLSDSKVQDPTSSEIGNLNVVFYYEKKQRFDNVVYWRMKKDYGDNYRWFPHGTEWSSGTDTSAKYMGSSTESSVEYDCLNLYKSFEKGATVEGSQSNQRFASTSAEPEQFPTCSIGLKLRAKKEYVTVKETKHIFCTKCGKKNKRKNNFCFNCGTKTSI